MRLLTDQAGTIVGTSSYDAYGRTLTHTGTANTIFGYTGQQTDPTGLIYLRARYYDPATAGFLTVDPAYDDTRAWYAYAGADPLDGFDPSGLRGCSLNPLSWGSCAESLIARLAARAVGGFDSKVQGTVNAIKNHQKDAAVLAAVAAIQGHCGEAVAYWAHALSLSQSAAAISDALRLPDYVSFEVSGGAFGVGAGVIVTGTRYGSIFLGPEAGFMIPGVSGALRAGWIDQKSAPSKSQLNSFVKGNTVSVSGYVPMLFGVAGPSVSEVWGNPGHGGWSAFATEVGLGAGAGKNVALLGSYSWDVSNSGPKW